MTTLQKVTFCKNIFHLGIYLLVELFIDPRSLSIYEAWYMHNLPINDYEYIFATLYNNVLITNIHILPPT